MDGRGRRAMGAAPGASATSESLATNAWNVWYSKTAARRFEMPTA